LELKERLSKIFPEVEIILFSSKARGDSDLESDIDLLILIDRPVNNEVEEKINDITYELELMLFSVKL
jgi:predicted nucleotidyltransferase